MSLWGAELWQGIESRKRPYSHFGRSSVIYGNSPACVLEPEERSVYEESNGPRQKERSYNENPTHGTVPETVLEGCSCARSPPGHISPSHEQTNHPL